MVGSTSVPRSVLRARSFAPTEGRGRTSHKLAQSTARRARAFLRPHLGLELLPTP
nr:MAG TPA: hypothetical protein [Caudoviricetes sp.]